MLPSVQSRTWKMKNQPKTQPNRATQTSPAPKGRKIVGLLTLAVAAVLGVCLYQSRPAATSQTAQPAATNSLTSVGMNGLPAAATVFDKLVGRWLRPDGGYVLQIKSVAPNGLMEAAYFNPNPIHVARAAALRDGAGMKVFVE